MKMMKTSRYCHSWPELQCKKISPALKMLAPAVLPSQHGDHSGPVSVTV